MAENLSLGQSARGTGIAQAYGDHATATVTIQGITPEQVEALLRAAGGAQQSKIEQLSRQLNTTQEAVRGFLQILKQEAVPLEKLPQTLAAIAQRHSSMVERLSGVAPEDVDQEAQTCITRAREILLHANSLAAYREADALLEKAESSYIRDIERAELLQKEALEAASRKRTAAAASRAERGELSLTRLNYMQAAEHFKAAAILVGGDGEARWRYLIRSGLALYRHGYEKGDNSVLERAIAVYRQLLQEYRRERVPLQWAMTQNNLGEALTVLGARESGTMRLEEALSAFREALNENMRERVPLDWAMTQHNLGWALWELGKREAGSARLEEAVTAFREALKERTRERVPLAWAMTQNNLAATLTVIGARESGTERLEEAVAASRDALKEHTQERVPLDWAMTQDNLGAALALLGARENRTERLEEAVTAFREALKENTRGRNPLAWATTQHGLASVLYQLGA